VSLRSHSLTDAEARRIEEIDRLVLNGAHSVPDLIGALGEKSWTVRRAVVAGLAALGDDAVMGLCTWLRDVRSSEAAIAAAVDALAASIGSTVPRHVFSLLLDNNPAVAADGAQILGRRRAGEAVSRLTSLLAHEDDNVSVAAIEALGAIGGTAAVDALIGVVESRRFFRTFPAIQVLARTGDPRAVQPLAALLYDDTYRLEVLRALGRTGSANAIAPILSALKSPSDAMVRLVAVSLSDLIERADWAGSGEQVGVALRDALGPWLARFTNALRGADLEERTAIVHVLGRAGDSSILPAITSMLEDEATASAATSALEYLGRRSDDALIEALATPDVAKRMTILPLVRSRSAAIVVRSLLRDDNPEVRARACEALARIGDISSVPAMFDALADKSPRVAHAAITGILTLGTGETERLALEAAASPNSAVRRHAIRLLGALGFPKAFDILKGATGDPDRKIAELAIVGLAVLDDPRVDTELSALASANEPGIRAAAMRACGQRGGDTAHKLLVRGCGDHDPWVRYYAAQGLGKLAPNAQHADSCLVERLRDEAPQVRIAALEALSRVNTPAAWEAICAAAASSDPDERRAGLVGVGLHARDGACSILLSALRSADPPTRLVALAGLTRLREPEALAALSEAVGDPSDEMRDAALSILAEREDEAAARVLVDWALKADASHPVHRALSRPGHNRIAVVMGKLANADGRAAPRLVAALARMGTDAATNALFDAITLPSSPTRANAAASLISLRVPGAVRTVTTLAATDPDPDVRRTLRAALSTT
jgi:HEAT repeat protein